MHWRLENIPVFEKKEYPIPADIFNTIRLGKIRKKKDFYFTSEKFRALAILLEDEEWIVVDRDLNELPVMAWTEFHKKGRNNLHLPVSSTFLSYHQHAETIAVKILDFAVESIQEILRKK